MQNFLTSRMDYVFFIYGLCFISLSVICFLLSKNSKTKISWSWLGIFVFLYGTNEWLDSWSLCFDDNTAFKWAHLGIRVVSFLFLIEFARSTFLRSKLKFEDDKIENLSFKIALISLLGYGVMSFAFSQIQFLRLILACASSLSFWYYYETIRVKNSKQLIVLKTYLKLVIPLIVVVLVAGCFVSDWYKAKEEMRQRNFFLFLAQRTSQTINSEEIKSLTGSKADLKISSYQQLKTKLMILYEGMPQVKRLYFIRPQKVNNIVLVDTEAFSSKDGFLPGQVFNQDHKIIRDVFNSAKPFIESAVNLPEGDSLLSGYYPLTDGRTGATIAVLGIDQDAHEYISAMAFERIKIFIMIATLCLIIFLTFIYAHKFWIFTHQLEGWQNADWYLQWGNAIIVIIIGLALTIGFYIQARRDAFESFQMIFSERSAGRIEVIKKDLESQINEIKQLKNIFERIPSFNRQSFAYFVRPQLQKSPLEGILWVPRVAQAERIDYENRAQLDGINDPGFKQMDPDGKMVIATERDEYYPIYFIEPLKGNEKSFGYDIATDPIRLKAMKESCDENIPVATAPVHLVNKINQAKSVIVFMPVYLRGEDPLTIEGRRKNLRGFIELVFNKNFLKVIYSAMPAEGLAAMVEDVSASPEDRVIYRHKIRLGGINWDKPFIKFILPIDMADRVWRVTIVPSTVFIANYLSSGYLSILPFGILTTLLLALFLNTLIRSRQQAERLVHIRTSELQDANRALERTHAELRESTAQMMNAEKFTALGEMAGGIAHELNQPLNVTKIICQGLLNDIRKDRLSVEDLKKDLPEVVIQMNKMAEIIEHMRAFTAVKSGDCQKTFEINTVIENAFKFIGAQMSAHGINVKKELAAGLPELSGDPIALEQAILNILSNARNAVEVSGKKEKNITVKTSFGEDKTSICIEIADNGIGIPADAQDKIFQPFFTTKNALAPDGRPVKGKGLGLSVAQKIVKDHSGEIILTSQEGIGSTFKILLPVI